MTQAQNLLGIGPGTKFNPIQASEIQDSDEDDKPESAFSSKKFGDINEQEISQGSGIGVSDIVNELDEFLQIRKESIMEFNPEKFEESKF